MAKAIMIQGTMSNAGKSLLVAGLCRVLAQDGLRVAPFKSQNMALNSFITLDGLEMGRAQVMQAEAAGIEPTIEMNPILLKPTGETGSQVILNGEVLGNMPAREYFKKKRSFIPAIMKAYEALASRFDVIVLEGAGSPAEINLKADDIVNMGMAKLADCPVLLVGDIDRGGVFASLYGTVELLEPEERARIKGLIVNKFRGDIDILKPGLAMIEDLTGIPVVGTIPFLRVDIDDEDSLSPRLEVQAAPKAVDIAVIHLPHISNFTDFSPLERFEALGVRYVARAGDFGSPDLVILPGTKNTMYDLKWLRQGGLEAKIKQYASAGGPVIGICGGFQMLGRELSDPQGVEEGGSLAGLGLLPVTTLFAEHKTRTRIRGVVEGAAGFFAPLNGSPVEGYEIHMGETKGENPFCRLEDSRQDGAAWGNVWGTYLHGIFEGKELTGRLASLLLSAKGMDITASGAADYRTYKEGQYDLLADGIRANMDMKAVYRILEEGP